MSDEFDELTVLYRAARACERSSNADRTAVRLALSTAIAAGVQGTTVTAAAAVAPSWLKAIVGGKFFGGLVVGVTVGTVATTTAYVAQRRWATEPVPTSRAQARMRSRGSAHAVTSVAASAANAPSRVDEAENFERAAPIVGDKVGPQPSSDVGERETAAKLAQPTASSAAGAAAPRRSTERVGRERERLMEEATA